MERLTTVLPEAWRPYAKFVYALVVLVVGLLVSVVAIDDETGIKIVQGVTAAAALLGIIEIPNQPQQLPARAGEVKR